jgi:hypothetical protein
MVISLGTLGSLLPGYDAFCGGQNMWMDDLIPRSAEVRITCNQ